MLVFPLFHSFLPCFLPCSSSCSLLFSFKQILLFHLLVSAWIPIMTGSDGSSKHACVKKEFNFRTLIQQKNCMNCCKRRRNEKQACWKTQQQQRLHPNTPNLKRELCRLSFFFCTFTAFFFCSHCCSLIAIPFLYFQLFKCMSDSIRFPPLSILAEMIDLFDFVRLLLFQPLPLRLLLLLHRPLLLPAPVRIVSRGRRATVDMVCVFVLSLHCLTFLFFFLCSHSLSLNSHSRFLSCTLCQLLA